MLCAHVLEAAGSTGARSTGAGSIGASSIGASSIGASSIGASSTGFAALVLVAPVLAPVLQAMCYKHQCIASGTVTVLLAQCAMVISDMSNGHNETVFRMLYPKFSTGQEKLAPTGWHGRHVFATLPDSMIMIMIIDNDNSDQVLVPQLCPTDLRTNLSYTRDYILIANFIAMVISIFMTFLLIL